MLNRLLANPHASIFLNGNPSRPVDIAAPINRVKSQISTFPVVVPPT